jgi:hypothetical protein
MMLVERKFIAFFDTVFAVLVAYLLVRVFLQFQKQAVDSKSVKVLFWPVYLMKGVTDSFQMKADHQTLVIIIVAFPLTVFFWATIGGLYHWASRKVVDSQLKMK